MTTNASLQKKSSGTIKRRVLPVVAAVAYLTLLAGRAATTTPYVDEAWYVIPAWNLATHGSFGTPVIETSASPMPGMPVSLQGIRSHTYWIMVFPLILKAAWFRIAGFSLLKARLFNIFWAVCALALWYFIIRRISSSTAVAVLALLLIGTDYQFVFRAVLSRDDMMSAALGYAGILTYLIFRERSLYRAVILSNTLIMAAGLTHPNGGLVGFAGLLTLTVYLDRKRLGWSHAAAVLMPYLAGAGLMSIYILKAPGDFAAQFLGNSSGRLPGLTAIGTLVPRELERYLNVYGLDTPTLAGKSKLIILAVYLAGVSITLINRKLREQYRLLILLTAAYVGTLTVFENYKVEQYAIYVIPFLAALTAVALHAMRSYNPFLTTAVISGLVVCNLGITARQIAFNGYRNKYVPAIRYIQAHGSAESLVMGSAEAGFDYGFDRNLIDDVRLGYHSKKQPDLILVDQRYRDFFVTLRKHEPDTYQHIQSYLTTQYEPVQVNESYTVYVRGPKQAASVASTGR